MILNIINILFLILLFIGSLFLDKLIFCIILTILAFFSLKELLSVKIRGKTIPIEIKVISYIVVIFFTINNYENSSISYLIDYKLLTIMLLAGFIPLIIINNKRKYNVLDASYVIGSTIFVGVTYNLLLQFRNTNINYVSYIILVAISTKIFEYIVSFFIGKTMLSPSVNPKKTLEGALGGIAISTIVSTMFFMNQIVTDLPLYVIVIISFALSIFGEFGNLIFSFIKKEFNKLNFCNYNSKISGILDIMDSVVYISLAFILFVSFL